MPMSKEEHEALLNELLSAELEQSRRTEILQQLRVDYGSVHTDFEQLQTTNTKLQANNDDLVISNSQLFRKLGTLGGDPEQKKKEDEKTFSETVTLETLESQFKE